MGIVMCFDPTFNSSRDSFSYKPTLVNARDSIQLFDQKRQKSQEAPEGLVMMNLKTKSTSSERSNVSLRPPLIVAMTSESRKSGTGLCWSPSTTDSYSVLPMTKVHSNLWIGNMWNSWDEDLLTREGITHVLSLTRSQSSSGKIERKQKVMNDQGRSDIKKVLDEVYEFMELGQKDNNNLLVHCTLGQNRSAVVVIAFLMKKYKIDLDRAHRNLKKVRPLVQVNVAYAKQLLDLEREYFGSNSLPSNWMERDNDEAISEVEFLHQNLSTDRQKSMFANTKNK